GAGGLIEHVIGAHGTVRVVYLTDGEGYPAGVRAEERRSRGMLSASDYRLYGSLRQQEARNALRRLGVDSPSLIFLAFPNNGLSGLRTRYGAEGGAAYRSRYPRRDRPPRTEVIEPDTEFRGEDLTQELARIVGEFKPMLIVTPRAEDQHVDHC